MNVVANVPSSTSKSSATVVAATVMPEPPAKKPKKPHTTVQVIEEVQETDDEEVDDSPETPSASSTSSSDVVYKVDNDLTEPEYDNLSWQPAAYAEETYKVVNNNNNVKPSAKHRNRENRPSHLQPTGLVTKLSSTVVNDGTTTLLETSVIGTFISDRYAQVLQSSAHILKNNNKHKISPTSTARILKTVAPVQATHAYEVKSSSGSSSRNNNNKNRRHEQNTPVKSVQATSQTGGGRFRSKSQNNRRDEPAVAIIESQTSPPPSPKSSKK